MSLIIGQLFFQMDYYSRLLATVTRHLVYTYVIFSGTAIFCISTPS
jgi:hypothetical protein